jgi:hypothetical protein
VKHLRIQNIALLPKWWWKLETQKDIWQDIVRAKYLKNKSMVSAKPRVTDSPCWEILVKAEGVFF